MKFLFESKFPIFCLISMAVCICFGCCTNQNTNKIQQANVEVSVRNDEANTKIIYPWVPISKPSDVLRRRLEPAGFENGVNTFLCRTEIENIIKPGKLWVFNNRNISCSTNHGKLEYLQRIFEVLKVPDGTTSWLPAINLPENAVVCGMYIDRELAHICRGWLVDALLVGNFRAKENVCHVTKDGRAYELDEDFEILVINALGRAVSLREK